MQEEFDKITPLRSKLNEGGEIFKFMKKRQLPRISINNQSREVFTPESAQNLELLKKMVTERNKYAKMGWILVNATHPGEFDDIPVKDDGSGWEKMPDGFFYQLNCPLDGLNPMGHATSMGDSSEQHKERAIQEALRMV